MSLNKANQSDYTLVGFNKNLPIEGLDDFAKNLEKHFFSKVTVRNLSVDLEQIKLVVELTCNFEFSEALAHLKKGIWGSFSSKKNSFASQFQKLRDDNNMEIELDEFSIFLNDTSIIINKIYNQSIPEQLESILNEMVISCHYFTQDQNEIPYEFYVPVYEENDLENQNAVYIKESKQPCKKDYFSFWGLYFHSDEDPKVYDLKNQILVDGSLQMLNR